MPEPGEQINETMRQQRELRSLVAGLSEHLTQVENELHACEEELRKLRLETIRTRKRDRRIRRFRDWRRSTRRRLLGRSGGNEMA